MVRVWFLAPTSTAVSSTPPAPHFHPLFSRSVLAFGLVVRRRLRFTALFDRAWYTLRPFASVVEFGRCTRASVPGRSLLGAARRSGRPGRKLVQTCGVFALRSMRLNLSPRIPAAESGRPGRRSPGWVRGRPAF